MRRRSWITDKKRNGGVTEIRRTGATPAPTRYWRVGPMAPSNRPFGCHHVVALYRPLHPSGSRFSVAEAAAPAGNARSTRRCRRATCKWFPCHGQSRSGHSKVHRDGHAHHPGAEIGFQQQQRLFPGGADVVFDLPRPGAYRYQLTEGRTRSTPPSSRCLGGARASCLSFPARPT